MLEIIRKNPWTGPLDFTLHSTRSGEVRYPFASFVRLPQPSSSQAVFPEFARLPAELQLHIISLCDTATLFQLMHANSFLRTEACKRFWASTEAWYWIDARWILSEGDPGHGNHALEVLEHVQQLEVDFEDLNELWKDSVAQETSADIDSDTLTTRHLEERASAFWRVLREKFPQVQRVVLSESIGGEHELGVSIELKTLRRKCPGDMMVSVSILRTADYIALERTLWNLVQKSDGTATWEVVTPLWSRTSVFLPLKQFHGLAGAYCDAENWNRRFSRRSYMALVILLEAVERHHFDGRYEPFTCPDFSCEVRLEARGQWTNHALDSLHYDSILPPEDLKAAYMENQRVLEGMQDVEPHPWQTLSAEFGVEGSEQRRKAERALLDQLGNDPLYATSKAPEKSALWANFIERMDEWGF